MVKRPGSPPHGAILVLALIAALFGLASGRPLSEKETHSERPWHLSPNYGPYVAEKGHPPFARHSPHYSHVDGHPPLAPNYEFPGWHHGEFSLKHKTPSSLHDNPSQPDVVLPSGEKVPYALFESSINCYKKNLPLEIITNNGEIIPISSYSEFLLATNRKPDARVQLPSGIVISAGTYRELVSGYVDKTLKVQYPKDSESYSPVYKPITGTSKKVWEPTVIMPSGEQLPYKIYEGIVRSNKERKPLRVLTPKGEKVFHGLTELILATQGRPHDSVLLENGGTVTSKMFRDVINTHRKKNAVLILPSGLSMPLNSENLLPLNKLPIGESPNDHSGTVLPNGEEVSQKVYDSILQSECNKLPKWIIKPSGETIMVKTLPEIMQETADCPYDIIELHNGVVITPYTYESVVSLGTGNEEMSPSQEVADPSCESNSEREVSVILYGGLELPYNVYEAIIETYIHGEEFDVEVRGKKHRVSNLLQLIAVTHGNPDDIITLPCGMHVKSSTFRGVLNEHQQSDIFLRVPSGEMIPLSRGHDYIPAVHGTKEADCQSSPREGFVTVPSGEKIAFPLYEMIISNSGSGKPICVVKPDGSTYMARTLSELWQVIDGHTEYLIRLPGGILVPADTYRHTVNARSQNAEILKQLCGFYGMQQSSNSNSVVVLLNEETIPLHLYKSIIDSYENRTPVKTTTAQAQYVYAYPLVELMLVTQNRPNALVFLQNGDVTTAHTYRDAVVTHTQGRGMLLNPPEPAQPVELPAPTHQTSKDRCNFVRITVPGRGVQFILGDGSWDSPKYCRIECDEGTVKYQPADPNLRLPCYESLVRPDGKIIYVDAPCTQSQTSSNCEEVDTKPKSETVGCTDAPNLPCNAETGNQHKEECSDVTEPCHEDEWVETKPEHDKFVVIDGAGNLHVLEDPQWPCEENNPKDTIIYKTFEDEVPIITISKPCDGDISPMTNPESSHSPQPVQESWQLSQNPSSTMKSTENNFEPTGQWDTNPNQVSPTETINALPEDIDQPENDASYPKPTNPFIENNPELPIATKNEPAEVISHEPTDPSEDIASPAPGNEPFGMIPEHPAAYPEENSNPESWNNPADVISQQPTDPSEDIASPAPGNKPFGMIPEQPAAYPEENSNPESWNNSAEVIPQQPFDPSEDIATPAPGHEPFGMIPEQPAAYPEENSNPASWNKPAEVISQQPFDPSEDIASPAPGNEPFGMNSEQPAAYPEENSNPEPWNNPAEVIPQQPFDPSEDIAPPASGHQPFGMNPEQSAAYPEENANPEPWNNPAGGISQQPFDPSEDIASPSPVNEPFGMTREQPTAYPEENSNPEIWNNPAEVIPQQPFDPSEGIAPPAPGHEPFGMSPEQPAAFPEENSNPEPWNNYAEVIPQQPFDPSEGIAAPAPGNEPFGMNSEQPAAYPEENSNHEPSNNSGEVIPQQPFDPSEGIASPAPGHEPFGMSPEQPAAYPEENSNPEPWNNSAEVIPQQPFDPSEGIAAPAPGSEPFGMIPEQPAAYPEENSNPEPWNNPAEGISQQPFDPSEGIASPAPGHEPFGMNPEHPAAYPEENSNPESWNKPAEGISEQPFDPSEGIASPAQGNEPFGMNPEHLAAYPEENSNPEPWNNHADVISQEPTEPSEGIASPAPGYEPFGMNPEQPAAYPEENSNPEPWNNSAEVIPQQPFDSSERIAAPAPGNEPFGMNSEQPAAYPEENSNHEPWNNPADVIPQQPFDPSEGIAPPAPGHEPFGMNPEQPAAYPEENSNPEPWNNSAEVIPQQPFDSSEGIAAPAPGNEPFGMNSEQAAYPEENSKPEPWNNSAEVIPQQPFDPSEGIAAPAPGSEPFGMIPEQPAAYPEENSNPESWNKPAEGISEQPFDPSEDIASPAPGHEPFGMIPEQPTDYPQENSYPETWNNPAEVVSQQPTDPSEALASSESGNKLIDNISQKPTGFPDERSYPSSIDKPFETSQQPMEPPPENSNFEPASESYGVFPQAPTAYRVDNLNHESSAEPYEEISYSKPPAEPVGTSHAPTEPFDKNYTQEPINEPSVIGSNPSGPYEENSYRKLPSETIESAPQEPTLPSGPSSESGLILEEPSRPQEENSYTGLVSGSHVPANEPSAHINPGPGGEITNPSPNPEPCEVIPAPSSEPCENDPNTSAHWKPFIGNPSTIKEPTGTVLKPQEIPPCKDEVSPASAGCLTTSPHVFSPSGEHYHHLERFHDSRSPKTRKLKKKTKSNKHPESQRQIIEDLPEVRPTYTPIYDENNELISFVRSDLMNENERGVPDVYASMDTSPSCDYHQSRIILNRPNKVVHDCDGNMYVLPLHQDGSVAYDSSSVLLKPATAEADTSGPTAFNIADIEDRPCPSCDPGYVIVRTADGYINYIPTFAAPGREITLPSGKKFVVPVFPSKFIEPSVPYHAFTTPDGYIHEVPYGRGYGDEVESSMISIEKIEAPDGSTVEIPVETKKRCDGSITTSVTYSPGKTKYKTIVDVSGDVYSIPISGSTTHLHPNSKPYKTIIDLKGDEYHAPESQVKLPSYKTIVDIDGNIYEIPANIEPVDKIIPDVLALPDSTVPYPAIQQHSDHHISRAFIKDHGPFYFPPPYHPHISYYDRVMAHILQDRSHPIDQQKFSHMPNPYMPPMPMMPHDDHMPNPYMPMMPHDDHMPDFPNTHYPSHPFWNNYHRNHVSVIHHP